MKKINSILLLFVVALTLWLIPSLNYGQTLGTTANFVLFSSNGAVSNTGLSQLTGNVGTNAGSSTAFGNVNGVMHDNDGASAQCATDLLVLYNQLNTATTTQALSSILGNGQSLNAGVYAISSAATLNSNLILNAQNNASAIFIIKIQGSLSTSALSQVQLINGAKACNVYWKAEGLVSMAPGSTMRGTIVANNGAINMGSGDILEGRALSTTGAITVNKILAYTPIGCGSPYLTGPSAPNLGSAACYAVFSSNGPVTNTGVTNVLGDVGTNVGLTTGFNPLLITGTLHPIPDGSTTSAAADLLIAYNYLNAVPYDIELLYPAQLGHNLVLTPHTYIMNGAATLTDSLYLNAQGNANAVFIIHLNGALTTSAYAKVLLINGTQSKNVYWEINGAVNIANNSIFNGTIVCNNGAIDLTTAVTINGRALTTNGSLSTAAVNVSMPAGCGGTASPTISTDPSNQIACLGSSASFSVAANGTSLTYQWRKGSVNLINGGSITGATSATLTINPTSLSDAATTYNVIVAGLYSPNDTSANASLTINQAPSITTVPVNETVCTGSPASFAVVATGAGLTYQWRKGTVNIANTANITGATTATLSIGATTLSDAGTTYNVVVSGTCSPAATSTNVSLILNTTPAITTAPMNLSVCAGGIASFAVTATGTGLTYQWRKGTVNLVNGANISGATTSNLFINPANTADASTVYNVVITGTCGPAVTSANAFLVIDTSPSISTVSGTQTVCAGTSASFTVTTTGTGLTYQWRRGTLNLVNSATITGATSATLTINPTVTNDAATNYNVVVSGTCLPAVTSSNMTLVVNSAPLITTPATNQEVCTGSNVNFTIVATGSNLTYQWRKGTVNIVNGGNISGATTATLSISAASASDASTVYNVVITGTCSPSVTSAFVSLAIDVPPSISSISGTQTLCAGSSVTFTTVATGTGLTYQWRRGTLDLVNSATITGATSSTLSINPTVANDAATNYNVVVSGVCSPAATSTNATLIVNTAPLITNPISNQEVCSGSNVNFTAVATGTNLTYQWRKGIVNIVNGGNISGATTATLSISAASVSDASTVYNVVITGTCSPSVTSNNASLIIDTPPSITSVSGTQTLCAGASVSFTTTATGTGLTYQWRRGTLDLVNSAAITGATSSTLTINPTVAGDAATNYNVVVSGTCLPAATSTNVTLNINGLPLITNSPISQTVCAGSTANFTVGATGAGLTYQWRKGSINMTNGGNIAGATSSTLTISPASAADASNAYNVVISGTCAPSVSSNNVALIINSVPNLNTILINQTVCAGTTATFSISATGTGLTYQWRIGTTDLVNGGNISGANSATLTINPANVSDAATNYNVVVSGTCLPAVTSGNAYLAINTVPAITSGPNNQIVCEGSALSFNVSTTGTALSYQWRKGTTNLVNGGNISGATSSTLTIDPANTSDASTLYNVVVTGTCVPALVSSNAFLVVNSLPLMVTPPTSQNVCLGTAASFNASATGTALTYQWRRGSVNLVNGGNISGANSATLTINPTTLLDADNNYSVLIAGTCPPSIISTNVTLAIDVAAVITTAPSDQNICSGNTASFSVNATGTSLTYQWRRGTVNLTNTGNISGATSATLVINPATVSDEATDYNVVVTGTCAPSTTSANAALSINIAPSITTAPIDQSVCAGSVATFNVSATGTGLVYQWRKGNVDILNGGNITGADSETLIINPATTMDAATNYNVVVTGFCTPPSQSGNVTLMVDTTTIATMPTDQTLCAGSLANFTVVATGTNLVYQWRIGTVNLVDGGHISGVNTPSLTLNPTSPADAALNYNVVVTGDCSVPSQSNNVALLIETAPVITVQPNNQLAMDGTSVSFWVTATGSNLTYQWRKGNINLVNGGNISGATSSILTINPASALDTASVYNVVVSGTCPSAVTSANAILWVCPNGLSPIDDNHIASVFPNPFNEQLNIAINNPAILSDCQLSIYNIFGAEVLSMNLTDQLTTVNIGHLASGYYAYRIVSNNKTIQTGKLVSE